MDSEKILLFLKDSTSQNLLLDAIKKNITVYRDYFKICDIPGTDFEIYYQLDDCMNGDLDTVSCLNLKLRKKNTGFFISKSIDLYYFGDEFIDLDDFMSDQSKYNICILFYYEKLIKQFESTLQHPTIKCNSCSSLVFNCLNLGETYCYKCLTTNIL